MLAGFRGPIVVFPGHIGLQSYKGQKAKVTERVERVKLAFSPGGMEFLTT